MDASATMLGDLTKETELDEYGPDYYAFRFGGLPYERSAHWVNFFSIMADQLIRAIQPRRVLDAGCAMGFLVEAFWDRGVYCEGIDISEYAISQVRRDIRPYCSVGSLIDPLANKYDLITCIEVLEHLPPEIVRAAAANICEATEVILFSSTPSDLEEPTHYSVHPPIYWLQLFSEFGFWPDARFDASFVASHTMLLRKKQPPSDDFLRLYSEYIRFKMALEAKSAESYAKQAEVNAGRARLEELNAALSVRDGNAIALEAQLRQVTEQVSLKETERVRLEQSVNQLLLDRDSLRAEAEGLRRAFEAMEHEAGEPRRWLAANNLSAAQLQTLVREHGEAQATLRAVFESRGWRLVEKCRTPLRKIRRDWPGLHRLARFVARKALGRSTSGSGTAEQNNRTASGTGVPLTSEGSSGEEAGGASADDAYQKWIREQEPTAPELASQRETAKRLDGPLFSVIVPVHQIGLPVLKACIESVLNQTYPRWQLCAAITPESDVENLRFLRKLAASDNRVCLTRLKSNEGISNNTNAALDAASGDFIVLLDHDDALAPFALFEVACRLKTSPDLDIIYSDHDYLDAELGLRCSPLFKPDWSPAIMFSANYITHLTVVRRSLVDGIGPFRQETDGAQDWDLFLRASEATSRISHIAKILYHWRMHAGSTAQNNSAKDYVAAAQLKAIGDHLKRAGWDAKPEVLANGLLHVRFNQTPTGLVSIVIPTKDRVDLLSRCISSLVATTSYDNFEILIVDNGSVESATAEYFKTLETDPRIRVIWHPGPFNYSAVNNRAAREANGSFLLFLNNDVEITRSDWLSELVCWASLPDIGTVGAKLLRANGSIQHAGVIIGLGGFADHPFADEPALTFGMAGSTGWYRDLLAVTGACMMMRRKVFEEVGGFDEQFILCGSDVEICLRTRDRGYRVVYNPFVELIHHERQTRGTAIPDEDFVESLKHYRPWLATGDPYWNPNLSLWSNEPQFRYRSEQSTLNFAEDIAAKAATRLETSQRVDSGEDERAMVHWFDCNQDQVQQVREQNESALGKRQVRRILWFIPAFEVPFYGGIFTILRFCESWARQAKVELFFAVCGAAKISQIVSLIGKVFPGVKADHVFVLDTMQQASHLPEADVSICTLWTTPYYALHHKAVSRRFYLIQDFEPAFYRAGSISALAESTYRMGLYGIANTISLRNVYQEEYGGKAIYFTPRINKSVFYPAEQNEEDDVRKPLQVFFYGRPKHSRNAFELVAQAMKYLKARLGDRVRIVSAGDAWKPAEYGLQGIVENLGLMSYADSARLYRESQVGVVMMLTRHPSYIPLELMASGCLAVTNVNVWTAWLLQDGENCLLSLATSSSIAETVERGLLDTSLRNRIRTKALNLVESEFLDTDWDAQAQSVYDYLCDPEAVAGDFVGQDNSVAAAN